MVKLCIFDMDGTLVNTLNSIAYFANRALEHYGLPAIETERYKRMVGNGADVLVQRMIDAVGGTREQYEQVRALYNKSYDDDFLYLTAPYDGVCDLLRELKSNGIKTAILSNKPDSTAQKVSDALFGSTLIDLCRGGRSGVPLKPDPQAVFQLQKALGAAPEECLYIGDTATDIETAKNAGLFSIGVLWGFRDRAELTRAGADAIIADPAEIAALARAR